jgi:hypothetical protein
MSGNRCQLGVIMGRKGSRVLNCSLTRRRVLAVVLMLLYAEACGALTSVVLVRTAKEIGIAADSEEHTTSAGGTTAAPICKIRRAGHVYFSLAGVIADQATGLDAYQTAEQAARGSASVQGAAESFRKTITPYLVPAAENVRRHYPVYYQQKIRNASLLEAMFFGVEHKVPVAVIATFAVVDWNASVPTIVPTLAVDRERGNAVDVLWIGSIDAIFRMMHNEGWRQIIAGLAPPEAALALVNVAMHADPAEIAPPVDVLRIRGNRARWRQKSRASKCREFRLERRS